MVAGPARATRRLMVGVVAERETGIAPEARPARDRPSTNRIVRPYRQPCLPQPPPPPPPAGTESDDDKVLFDDAAYIPIYIFIDIIFWRVSFGIIIIMRVSSIYTL